MFKRNTVTLVLKLVSQYSLDKNYTVILLKFYIFRTRFTRILKGERIRDYDWLQEDEAKTRIKNALFNKVYLNIFFKKDRMRILKFIKCIFTEISIQILRFCERINPLNLNRNLPALAWGILYNKNF